LHVEPARSGIRIILTETDCIDVKSVPEKKIIRNVKNVKNVTKIKKNVCKR